MSWSIRKGVKFEPEDRERNTNRRERWGIKKEKIMRGRNRRG